MTYSAQVLADSPVVYYRLDDTSGTSAVDSSGNTRTGTYAGGFTLNQSSLPGLAGTAVLFNGTSGKCSRTGNTAFYYSTAGLLTIEFWYKGTAVGSNTANTGAAFIACNDSSTAKRWIVKPNASGHVQLEVGDSYNILAGSTPVNDNTWHHIACTITSSGTSAQIYVDHVLDASASGIGFNAGTGTPDLVIAENTRATAFCAGLIDEVAIYPTVLSSTRITAHYIAGIARDYMTEVLSDAPSAFWKLDEASGSTFADSSGNARDLAITGTPSFHQTSAGVGVPNAAVQFSGSEYAQLPAPSWFSSPANFTFEALVKFTSSGSLGLMSRDDVSGSFANDRVAGIDFGSGAGVFDLFSPGYTPCNASGTENDGAWHLITCTFAAGSAVFYVDAVSRGTATSGSPLNSGGSAPFMIAGRYQSGVGVIQKYIGTMGPVSVYPTALSQTRIATHLAGIDVAPSTLVSLTDTGTGVDDLVVNILTALTESAAGTDALTVEVHGGPVITVDPDDVHGASDVFCYAVVDGDPYFALDIIDGVTDIELATSGPIFADLDVIDGASEVLLGMRGQLFAALDPIDGQTLFLYTINPGDPTQSPLGVAGQLHNEPIAVAVELLGSLRLIPPVAVG